MRTGLIALFVLKGSSLVVRVMIRMLPLILSASSIDRVDLAPLGLGYGF